MEFPAELIRHQIHEGVFLVHKPKEISSFALLRRLWNVCETRKIGHAGTLDPLASGLMIVGVGPGTKNIAQFVKLSKTYLVELILGKSTSTGDLEGDITEKKIVYKSDIAEYDIEKTVVGMLGTHTLEVPMYSAIKVQGKALYKYARNNQVLDEIPRKEMQVLMIQLLDHYPRTNEYVIKLRMEVSSGSYIRTLVEEFGRRMGYPATTMELYRLSIAEYLDQDAYRIKT